MRIAVIGASGRTGKYFVERALASGHSVRAGILHTNTLEPHKRLTITHCDATNLDDLKALLRGQEVVISFMGHVKGSPAHVQTDAMKALVRTMRAQNLTRIVSLTGTGVRFPDDNITLVDRALNLVIGVIDPARIRDGIAHVEVLTQSELDWTVIRVLKLQNTGPKPFSLREHGPTKWYVSRHDVAAAALQILEEGSFVRQAPVIGKP